MAWITISARRLSRTTITAARAPREMTATGNSLAVNTPASLP